MSESLEVTSRLTCLVLKILDLILHLVLGMFQCAETGSQELGAGSWERGTRAWDLSAGPVGLEAESFVLSEGWQSWQALAPRHSR